MFDLNEVNKKHTESIRTRCKWHRTDDRVLVSMHIILIYVYQSIYMKTRW